VSSSPVGAAVPQSFFLFCFCPRWNNLHGKPLMPSSAMPPRTPHDLVATDFPRLKEALAPFVANHAARRIIRCHYGEESAVGRMFVDWNHILSHRTNPAKLDAAECLRSCAGCCRSQLRRGPAVMIRHGLADAPGTASTRGCDAPCSVLGKLGREAMSHTTEDDTWSKYQSCH
jgi:hypothetical protein